MYRVDTNFPRNTWFYFIGGLLSSLLLAAWWMPSRRGSNLLIKEDWILDLLSECCWETKANISWTLPLWPNSNSQQRIGSCWLQDLGGIANPMFRLKGLIMIEGNYSPAFPLKHQQKDMRLALALSDQNATSMPVAATANEVISHFHLLIWKLKTHSIRRRMFNKPAYVISAQ